MNDPRTHRPSWLWYSLGTCVVILAVAVMIAWNVHRHHRYKHFAVHQPGKVYRSAWVDADVFAELIEKYHIQTVVNLCFPGEMGDRNLEQRRAVEGAGAKLIEIEFPPNDTWDVNYTAVDEMEHVLDDPKNYPLWIHCQHGRERTVKALAMYDIRERNMSAKESLAPMPRFDLEHPWPVVVFAYNYETLMKHRRQLNSRPNHELQANTKTRGNSELQADNRSGDGSAERSPR